MSLILIDGTKPLPPKYVRKIHPLPAGTQNPRGRSYFKSHKEEREYWEGDNGEFFKWIDGIRGADGEQIINGLHYSFIQEATLYDLDNNRFFSPNWRDVDDIIFTDLQWCLDHNLDYFGIKRRGLGWSSIFMWVAMYMALTKEGMEIPITSADEGRTQRLINNNLIPIYTNLNSYYKPVISKKALQKGEVIFAENTSEIVERNGRLIKLDSREGSNSAITVKPTTKNPRIFESVRTKFGFVDEAFLNQNITTIKSSMRLCFGAGMKKKGTLVLGGSAGENEKNISAMTDCANMYFDAKKLGEDISGMRTRFFAGTMGDPDYSTNGWSDEVRAREEILRQLDNLSKKTDKTEYLDFKHGMPLTEEDVFDIRQNDLLPAEIVEALNQQKIVIRNTPDLLIERGRMEGTHEDPVFVPDDINGDVYVYARPDKNVEEYSSVYIGGEDPIPFEGEDEDNGSQFSQIIIHKVFDTPVAFFLRRTLDINYIYEQTTLLSAWYGKNENLLELNRGSYYFNFVLGKGMKKFFAKCPSKCGLTKGTKGDNLGVRATTGNLVHAHSTMVMWLYRNTKNIWFILLIDQLLNLGKPNQRDDLVDAFKWALVAHEDWAAKKTQQLKPSTSISFTTTTTRNGITTKTKIYKKLNV